jgi:N6-L-threonylcarbamoyladenine synthase
MRILGIETSCDETAVCLIEGSGDFGTDFQYHILGNTLLSQVAIHAPYGGVYPNLAKREHAKNLVPILTQTLTQAKELRPASYPQIPDGGLTSADELRHLLEREPELYAALSVFLEQYKKPAIDAIAVTHGPGLEPALWVGVNFAKALSAAWNVPIVAVNHMEGHIVLSSILGREESNKMKVTRNNSLLTFNFPLLSLLISGGHTELVLSREFMKYELLGQTRDDAVGEAFDKVARLLDLPYPGGPEISRLAEEARNENLPQTIHLPRPMIHEDNLDFSFAGLKTAVRRLVDAQSEITPEFKKEIAREFEDATADVLIAKTLRAIDEFNIETVVVGGGVSANTHIRRQLAQSLEDYGSPAKLLIPPPDFATDNAIMIALAGYFHAKNGDFIDRENLSANGNLKLA